MLIVKKYFAAWCQPCKQLGPVFDDLQDEIREVIFETIDVDQNKELIAEKGITSVPTIVLEKNGVQVYRFSGVFPKATIAGIIRKHL